MVKPQYSSNDIPGDPRLQIHGKHIRRFEPTKFADLISHKDHLTSIQVIWLYERNPNVPSACREPGGKQWQHSIRGSKYCHALCFLGFELYLDMIHVPNVMIEPWLIRVQHTRVPFYKIYERKCDKYWSANIYMHLFNAVCIQFPHAWVTCFQLYR